MKHTLKTWPIYFQAAWDNVKTFEFRKNDRNYKVGDVLELQEYDPDPQTYSGRVCFVVVRYVLIDFCGMYPGYCVMAIELQQKLLNHALREETTP